MASGDHVMEAVLKLTAKLDPSFNAAIDAAQKAVGGIGNKADAKKKMDTINRSVTDAQRTIKKLTKNADADIKQSLTGLKSVNEALKFNPTSTELITQKQRYLGQAVDATKRKLQQQKAELDRLKASTEPEATTEQQAALTREIEKTQGALRNLQIEQSNNWTLAGGKLKGYGSILQKYGGQMTQFGAGLTRKLTVPIAAAVGSSIKTYGQFQSSMASVNAVTGATSAELEMLKQKALELGRTTVFTSAEVADAMQQIGMAGWKPKQIEQGMQGMVDLAAAAKVNIPEVSEIVVNGMNAFGMKANETQRFVDVMATAAMNSSTDVLKMGETFKYASAWAGTMGYSIEDVALATGLMGDMAVKGTQGGTALRRLIQGLNNPTAAAKKLFKDWGIDMVDEAGNAKSLLEQIKLLREHTKDLSTTDKSAAMKTLAGMYGSQGAMAIVNTSDEEFDKLVNSIEHSAGAAAIMRAKAQDNLQGDITLLKSAIDNFKIAFLDNFGDNFREIIQKITGGVTNLTEKLNNMSDGTKKVITRLMEMAAVAGPLIALFGGMTTGLGIFLEHAGTVHDKLSFLRDNGIVGNLLSKLPGKLGETKTVLGKIPGILGNIGKPLGEFLNPIKRIKHIFDIIKNGKWLIALNPKILAIVPLVMLIGGAIMAVIQNWDDLKGRFSGIADTLRPVFDSVKEAFSATWDAFKAHIKGIWDILKTLLQPIANLVGDIFQILAPILKVVIGIVGKIIIIVMKVWTVIMKIVEWIWTAISIVLEKVIAKFQQWHETAGAALSGFYEKWIKPAIDGMKQFKDNVSMLVDMVKDKIGELKERFANTFPKISGAIKTVNDRIASRKTPKAPAKQTAAKAQSVVKQTKIDTTSASSAITKAAQTGQAQKANIVVTADTTNATTAINQLKTIVGDINKNGKVKISVEREGEDPNKIAEDVGRLKSETIKISVKVKTSDAASQLATIHTHCQLIKSSIQQMNLTMPPPNTTPALAAVGNMKTSIVNTINSIQSLRWSLPKPRVPVFSMSGSFNAQTGSVPTVNVSWKRSAMAYGEILRRPTIFGMSGGKLLGAGEAGNEVVVGESPLYRNLAKIVRDVIRTTSFALPELEFDAEPRRNYSVPPVSSSKKIELNFDYNPTVNINNNGGKEVTEDVILAALEAHLPEVADVIQEALRVKEGKRYVSARAGV